MIDDHDVRLVGEFSRLSQYQAGVHPESLRQVIAQEFGNYVFPKVARRRAVRGESEPNTVRPSFDLLSDVGKVIVQGHKVTSRKGVASAEAADALHQVAFGDLMSHVGSGLTEVPGASW